MEHGFIYINDSIYATALAISEKEQSIGLMREENPYVMSFVYTSPRINKFWMANTPAALDIIFCLDGKIKQICKGEPYSTATIGDNSPSDLVIEMPYGTVNSNKIKLGAIVELIKPSKEELIKIIAEKYYFITK